MKRVWIELTLRMKVEPRGDGNPQHASSCFTRGDVGTFSSRPLGSLGSDHPKYRPATHVAELGPRISRPLR